MLDDQQIRRDANAFDQTYKDERYEQVKRDAEALLQQYILTAIFRAQNLCGHAEWCALRRMTFQSVTQP